MDLRALNSFAVVAEELHFRKAAARLNVTQPSLSMRIQALEREVGVSLLERNRRSVLLTEAGRAFLGLAQAAVRSGAEAVTQARRAARGEIGQLRFGFTALTSYAGMPELVQRFRPACPDIKIDLVQADSASLELRAAGRGDRHRPASSSTDEARPDAEASRTGGIGPRHPVVA